VHCCRCLEDGWLQSKVCNWLFLLRMLLLACQLVLYVVLPGCGSTLQQLRVLLCAEQLRWPVRGGLLLLCIWVHILQNLQTCNKSTVSTTYATCMLCIQPCLPNII
jgi:hypothetical protein